MHYIFYPDSWLFLKVLSGSPDATHFMMVHFTKAYPSPHLEHLGTYLSQCISQLLPLTFWCWMLFCRFAHNGIFCTPQRHHQETCMVFLDLNIADMDLPPLNSQSWIRDPHHWPYRLKERECLPEHQHERHDRSTFKAVPGVVGLLNPQMKMNESCNYLQIGKFLDSLGCMHASE